MHSLNLNKLAASLIADLAAMGFSTYVIRDELNSRMTNTGISPISQSTVFRIMKKQRKYISPELIKVIRDTHTCFLRRYKRKYNSINDA